MLFDVVAFGADGQRRDFTIEAQQEGEGYVAFCRTLPQVEPVRAHSLIEAVDRATDAVHDYLKTPTSPPPAS